MKKEELEKLAEKYQAKADTDYQNYQETGMTKYGTAYRKNEDMADAFRMAANAADEHHAYIAMKAQMATFAQRAHELKYADDEHKEDQTKALLRDIVAYGVMHGFVRRD
jgi:hypothetical protein